MKWFKSKSKSVLEGQVAELQRQLGAKEQQINYLISTIRQTDDLIWAMSQKSDWNQMRPVFNQLQDGMTARKVIESDRIGALVEGELRKTYDPNQKLLGKAS